MALDEGTFDGLQRARAYMNDSIPVHEKQCEDALLKLSPDKQQEQEPALKERQRIISELQERLKERTCAFDDYNKAHEATLARLNKVRDKLADIEAQSKGSFIVLHKKRV